jgi:hypothetical protein
VINATAAVLDAEAVVTSQAQALAA